MNQPVIFDIETASMPLRTIKSILPPWDPSSIGSHPGEFDPSSVKTGNIKDPEKIKAKIDEAREKHEKAVVDFEAKASNGEQSYWTDIVEKAALSATVGQVVAIGYHGKKRVHDLAIDGKSERQLLMTFWKTYKDVRQAGRQMIGFNIKSFDVPYLVQRSYVWGIDVPASILTPTCYLDQLFIDLLDRWKAGNRGFGPSGHMTLDSICRACGLPSKSTEYTGADFARLLYGTAEERASAIQYLDCDLDATVNLAVRMGFTVG